MQQHLRIIAAAAALCALAEPALAQTFKPVEALIVNPTSRPVPVTVVSATPAPTVRCRLFLHPSSGTSPIVRHTQADSVQEVHCPPGVSRLDVQRVVLASDAPQHRVFLALGSTSATGLVAETVLATLSDGTPDLALPRAVRIDFAAPSSPLFIAEQVCSSGMAGINTACGGDVYLVGTAAN
jgi:hypothetical protein